MVNQAVNNLHVKVYTTYSTGTLLTLHSKINNHKITITIKLAKIKTYALMVKKQAKVAINQLYNIYNFKIYNKMQLMMNI